MNPITDVYIGNNKATLISSTLEQIVIQSPSMAPGLYELIIPIGDIGNAL